MSDEALRRMATPLLHFCPQVQAVIFGKRFHQTDGAGPVAANSRNWLKQQLFYNEQPIQFATGNCVGPTNEHHLTLSQQEWDGYREALQSRDAANVRQWLSAMYVRLQAQPIYPAMSVKSVYSQLLRVAFDRRQGPTGIALNLAVGEEAETVIRYVQQLVRLQAVHHYVTRELTGLLDQSNEPSKDTTRRMIKELKAYIDDHLSGPIVLTDFAQQYGVTHGYLSTLFKREEKVNFHQYLKQARVNKAMSIMQSDGNQKIYEVAYKVGYTDSKHFSKVFRECTGLTPKEFIEKV